MKNRSEKKAERGQFLTISPGNSRSIVQESGKKWTVPPFLQPISFKPDRLLEQFAETVELDGVPIRTVNLEGLLRTKQTMRDKDAMDRIVLERALDLYNKQK